MRSERAEQRSRRQEGEHHTRLLRWEKEKKDNRLNREESGVRLEVNLKEDTEEGESFTRGLMKNISVCCQHLANAIFPKGGINQYKVPL